jgi:hypothetical protein
MAAIPHDYYQCFYSKSVNLQVGDYLYEDVALTTPVISRFYSDGIYCYTVVTGQITAKTVCP